VDCWFRLAQEEAQRRRIVGLGQRVRLQTNETITTTANGRGVIGAYPSAEPNGMLLEFNFIPIPIRISSPDLTGLQA